VGRSALQDPERAAQTRRLVLHASTAEEADFRFGLVRARENAEGVALLRGEKDERERLFGAFDGIRLAWTGQTRSQGRLMLLTNAYRAGLQNLKKVVEPAQ